MHKDEESKRISFSKNGSTELLEKNGKWLSGDRTRHINPQFLDIKDQVNCVEGTIEHYTA